MKRRNFIKTSFAASATVAVPGFLTRLVAQVSPSNPSSQAAAAASAPLPWEREMSLWEGSQSVVLENMLSRTNPLPDSGGFGASQAMTVNNLKMRTTMWGSPDRITISLNKNNVWDRRVSLHSLQAPTLQEITESVFSPANQDYVGIDAASDTLRPKSYGYLRKEGHV